VEAAKEAGILVDDSGASWVNSCFVLWFGAYGDTHVLTWAESIEDALEQASSELPKDMFTALTDSYTEALAELVAEGADPEDDETIQAAQEAAEVDMTYTESGYLASWEWGITFENPTLDQIKSLAK
jgi:CO/xanthine dehydrogenase Mo-binding subunit